MGIHVSVASICCMGPFLESEEEFVNRMLSKVRMGGVVAGRLT